MIDWDNKSASTPYRLALAIQQGSQYKRPTAVQEFLELTKDNPDDFNDMRDEMADWIRETEEQEAKEKTASDVELLARATVKQARTKQAFVAWGGGSLGLHPKGRGIGGELGYTNLLGLMPIPLGGIDIGGPRKGFQMGVTPDPGSEIGVSPYFGLRWNHPRRTGLTRSFPRGLPEVIYDKLRGRTKKDAMRASYPEWFEEEASKPKKKEKEKEKEKETAASDVELLACAAVKQARAGIFEPRKGIDDFKDVLKGIKQKFEDAARTAASTPAAVEATARGAEFGHRFAPGLVGGALAGGGLGLLADPGYDEQGRRRSRLARTLTGTLGGAALGGVSAAAFPGVAAYGAELGARHGFNKAMEPTYLGKQANFWDTVLKQQRESVRPYIHKMLQQGKSAIGRGAQAVSRGSQAVGRGANRVVTGLEDIISPRPVKFNMSGKPTPPAGYYLGRSLPMGDTTPIGLNVYMPDPNAPSRTGQAIKRLAFDAVNYRMPDQARKYVKETVDVGLPFMAGAGVGTGVGQYLMMKELGLLDARR